MTREKQFIEECAIPTHLKDIEKEHGVKHTRDVILNLT